jgi:hypothetical protein
MTKPVFVFGLGMLNQDKIKQLTDRLVHVLETDEILILKSNSAIRQTFGVALMDWERGYGADVKFSKEREMVLITD